MLVGPEIPSLYEAFVRIIWVLLAILVLIGSVTGSFEILMRMSSFNFLDSFDKAKNQNCLQQEVVTEDTEVYDLYTDYEEVERKYLTE